ncbi:hypothetical protein Tco_0725223 [Tanacetum coccineum]|uniref:Uncharacterized protein n=1 Tax=Tanacetum coccineum TaxID=301880 RepID=A0ABQ4YEP2_9ASTR
MANIRTCNKHNMIACVEKTEHNADFHQIVDYLTGCSINYSLLVDPDLIGPWLQQFWATASLSSINEVPHIRAMVAGKRVLISEETIRADLLFDDADGVDCFPKQVIWDSLRDIGYEVLRDINGVQMGLLASALGRIRTNKSSIFFGDYEWNASTYCNVLSSQGESSPRDAQGTPTQSAAQASILQGTADFQGTAEAQGAADIPQSPNDYTPTDESQTSGGDEGLLDLYALNREVRRLKKQNISQAHKIHKLKAKLKKLSKGVKPLVKHHILWVKSQKLKKRGKKQKKKVSSVKLGRNKDEGNLSEEHHDQDDHNHTAFVYEDFDATDAVVAVTPDLERKSDETEQVIIEEEKDTSDVKSGDTEELDLERIQSTARQSAVTPRTLNFDDEAGPSSPTQEEKPEEQFKDDEFLADIPLNISRTKCCLERFKQNGYMKKREKVRRFEVNQNQRLFEENLHLLHRTDQMMKLLKGQGYKNLQKLRYPQMKELYDKVQESIKDSLKDFIPMGSEKEKQMLQERDAKRLLRKRKAFNTLWEILHILDRQDLYHLYLVVQDYYKHIPPTGLGLILLGDLTTIWETSATKLEDGTMLHMLAERRYPLSRELMIRMLDHGMEVEDESETAITLIHLFILWTTEDGDDS